MQLWLTRECTVALILGITIAVLRSMQDVIRGSVGIKPVTPYMQDRCSTTEPNPSPINISVDADDGSDLSDWIFSSHFL